MVAGERALRDLVSGLVVCLVALSFYLSSAALIFQGPLAPHLSVGIGSAIAGGAILALFQAWKGSLRLASAGAEPTTLPIIATLTAAVAAQCTAATLLPTAVMALSLTALLAGATWFALGRFGAGHVIRYIPYPVIGGCLAVIGWLMFAGGIGVVLGEPFTLGRAARSPMSMAGAQLVFGLAIGTSIWWVTARVKHMLTLPALIAAWVAATHAWLWTHGIGIGSAREQGWLMREFALALPALPLSPAILPQVQWTVIANEAGTILSVVVLSVVSLLLSDSSLELAFDERADLNGDLKGLGLGNMAVALAGGLTGGLSISRSILNRDAGAATRMSGVIKALACLAAMLAGGPVIAMIPKPVLGGILIYLGIVLLKGWAIDGRKRLARRDHAVVLAMVALAVVAGALPALLVGVIVCCFDFAISSSRLGPVRRVFTRNEWPARVERSAPEARALRGAGGGLSCVELQGTLFFGSMRALGNRIEELINTTPTMERLVIDFRRVPWIDSSAAQAMARLIKVGAKAGVAVALSGASPAVLGVLAVNGCITATGPAVFEDIDHAFTAWDEAVLAGTAPAPRPLEEWLAAELGSADAVARLMDWVEKITLEPGEVLCSQGDPADSMYLVQEGRLAATIAAHGGAFKVRAIQAGGTVGEMGLYRQTVRSATVRAEVPSVVLGVTREALHDIERRAPELAIALHRLFVRLLASRLDHANAQTAALAA
jgi:SulP family sulfate permease